MELAPALVPRAGRLRQAQARAVDRQIQAGARIGAPLDRQRPTAAGQRRVVRHGQGKPEESEDGADQPFGLAQREAVDGPDR